MTFKPFLCALSLATSAFAAPPNMILINCDDLGYGDLGCWLRDEILSANPQP